MSVVSGQMQWGKTVFIPGVYRDASSHQHFSNIFLSRRMQGDRAIVCRVGPDELLLSRLAPGIHVLSNLHDPDEIDFGLSPDAGWEEMRPILADRSPRLPRGFAVCKDRGDRGTVASALIEPGRSFLFADGPPDRADYVSVSGYPD